MSNTTNIPTGLNVQTQIPLDTIKFIQNESLLSNLGDNNNLAFKYYDGLIIRCIDENSFYVWREVLPGEENTGLLSIDFTYPYNHLAFGINYSNKKYNFFQIQSNINQDNFVRILPVEFSDLGITNIYQVNVGALCDYINSLPDIEKTILETDSKWNIVIQETQETTIIYRIYEIINIGKGVITLLEPENLLAYNADIQNTVISENKYYIANMVIAEDKEVTITEIYNTFGFTPTTNFTSASGRNFNMIFSGLPYTGLTIETVAHNNEFLTSYNAANVHTATSGIDSDLKYQITFFNETTGGIILNAGDLLTPISFRVAFQIITP